jgi:hypothetical protein
MPEQGEYRGARLGLPRSGSGSMAGSGRRVVALFVDWFAATLIANVLVRSGGDPSAVSLVTMGVFALEVTLLTWLTGASFGQRILGIRVGGRTRRLNLLATAVRTVLICLVVPPLIWDSDGRGLHDRAVDSVVVRA